MWKFIFPVLFLASCAYGVNPSDTQEIYGSEQPKSTSSNNDAGTIENDSSAYPIVVNGVPCLVIGLEIYCGPNENGFVNYSPDPAPEQK